MAVELLRAELDTLRRYASETREAATHEEAKAENDKDTRGLEQSYLARGQAMRVEDVDEAIKRLRFMELPSFEGGRAIDLGALVHLRIYDEDGDEQERVLFLVPAGGGTKVTLDGVDITLLNPASPVGRALLERKVGDEFELRIAGRMKEHEVRRVE